MPIIFPSDALKKWLSSAVKPAKDFLERRDELISGSGL